MMHGEYERGGFHGVTPFGSSNGPAYAAAARANERAQGGIGSGSNTFLDPGYQLRQARGRAQEGTGASMTRKAVISKDVTNEHRKDQRTKFLMSDDGTVNHGDDSVLRVK